MTSLRISSELSLPLDAVTETFAFLAKRGAGKTYNASVLVEEMLKAGAQVVVLDPMDVWWGLRSSADGTGPGLPIAIFGGEHGDIPLEPTAGAFIAELVVSEGLSAILVLEAWSKADQRRFATDFGERLFQRNREALHLVLEEADRFAPQRPIRGEERMLGAYEEIVRRGRSKGIGCSLITQRSAVLHKDVLTQTEVLVAMRTPSKHDRRAIEDWFDAHEADQVADVMATVPSLPTGTAWISSPYWLKLLQLVPFRARETFDSSSTPKVGEARREVRTLADVDLALIKEQMAETIERAKADDPAELRRQITRLTKELAAAHQRADATPAAPDVVEVPVLNEALVERLLAERELAAVAEADRTALLLQHLEIIRERVTDVSGARPAGPPAKLRDATRSNRSVRHRPAAAPRSTPAAAGDVTLKAGARRIVEVLARHHPMRVTKAQVGTLTGFKTSGGTFSTYWSQIRRAGLVDDVDGLFTVTDAGLAYAGVDHATPLTTDELLDQWRSALKAGARAMLDFLVDVHPEAYTKEGLAQAVGMTASGGTFGTYLSTLRRNGLVDVAGDQVTASDTLFLGSRR